MKIERVVVFIAVNQTTPARQMPRALTGECGSCLRDQVEFAGRPIASEVRGHIRAEWVAGRLDLSVVRHEICAVVSRLLIQCDVPVAPADRFGQVVVAASTASAHRRDGAVAKAAANRMGREVIVASVERTGGEDGTMKQRFGLGFGAIWITSAGTSVEGGIARAAPGNLSAIIDVKVAIVD